jgi:hypothetical protein
MTMLVPLGSNVDATAAAAQTAVAMSDTPTNAYRKALIRMNSLGITGTPTVLIEGSENGGSTYSTLATFNPTATLPNTEQEVKLYPLTRLRVSVVGTAGRVNCYVEGIQ